MPVKAHLRDHLESLEASCAPFSALLNSWHGSWMFSGIEAKWWTEVAQVMTEWSEF